MKVDIGIEIVAAEAANRDSMLLGDVRVAEVLADDGAVLCLSQSIIIAAARARLGELDQQLVQKPGDATVDVLGSVVRVKGEDYEWELLQKQLEQRDQVTFADGLDRTHNLELRDLVDNVDVVDSFPPVQVALVDRVNAKVARLAGGIRPTSFTNLRDRGARLLEVPAVVDVDARVPQVVEVRYGNAGQVPVLGLTVNVVGTFTELLGSGAREGPM